MTSVRPTNDDSRAPRMRAAPIPATYGQPGDRQQPAHAMSGEAHVAERGAQRQCAHQTEGEQHCGADGHPAAGDSHCRQAIPAVGGQHEVRG
jgi:hypothetical protein